MLKRSLLIAATLILLCSSAWARLMESPWPKIHNDVKNSGYTTNVGTAIGKIKWQFATEKPITSSPTLDNNGRIYFGSADKNLYCLDRTTGGLIWKYPTQDAIMHSSPAIDENGYLYIGSSDGKLYAFDTNNINLADPQPIWTFATDGGIKGSPTIADDGTVIFASADGYLYAIDTTANPNPPMIPKWTSSHGLGIVWSTPTIDYIYPVRGDRWYTIQPTIMVGSTQAKAYDATTDTPEGGCDKKYNPPNLVGSTFFALDLETGVVLADGLHDDITEGHAIHGSIGIQPGGAYIIPFLGEGVAVGNIGRATVGDAVCEVISDTKELFEEGTGLGSDEIYATPTVHPTGFFYLGIGSTLYLIDPSMSSYFSYTTEGRIESSVALDGNGNAYFGCNGGVFYCINSNSPAQPLRWRYPKEGNLVKPSGEAAEIISSPAIDNDDKHSIYFGASDGIMYAFYDGATIRGKITGAGDVPLSSVEVTLKDSNGNIVLVTSTDTSGEFEFFGISSGKYTVIPKKDGYIFNPVLAPVTLSNVDAYVEFTADLSFTITGRIVNSTNGTGLPNVSVAIATKNAVGITVYVNETVTDINGDYTFINIGYGTSEVTPSLAGWGFTPPSVSQSIPATTPGGTVYTLATIEGTLGYQISGKVTDATIQDETANGLAQVTLTLTGTPQGGSPISQTFVTDATGVYSFSGLANGVYTVTPTRFSYKFDYSSREVEIDDANVANVNFAGAQGIKISGTIQLNAGDTTSFENFSVNLYLDDTTSWSKLFNPNKPRTLVASTTVNSAGNFSFIVAAGKYIVEPSAEGYSFDPKSISQPIRSDTTGLLFTAYTGLSISGNLRNVIGVPQSDVLVTLMGVTNSVVKDTTTNADGTYTFVGVVPGTYTVAPAESVSYVASPIFKTEEITDQDAENVNFTLISYCTKTFMAIPPFGAAGDEIGIIGLNFGITPDPTSTASYDVTLPDGSAISKAAGVYFGTADPDTWVKAKFTSWTPFYITVQVPTLANRIARVWVVRQGWNSCINTSRTNLFIYTAQ